MYTTVAVATFSVILPVVAEVIVGAWFVSVMFTVLLIVPLFAAASVHVALATLIAPFRVSACVVCVKVMV